MKILAIGNSFSQDATRYLHQIAAADGEDWKVVNLYIGGCPLSYHDQCIREDLAAYTLEVNGVSTGRSVTSRELLESDEWDVVTVQQVSQLAPRYETYQPYLDAVVSFVRRKCPKAKLFIHQTWAYEKDSERLCRELGYTKPQEMLDDVKAAYEKAADAVSADGTIRSGELFGKLLERGVPKVHRDTFHASNGLGRYALGLLWYHALTGRGVTENAFADFDEPITPEDVRTVKLTVSAM